MKPRVAMLMVHTCPLEQAGIGDAGGMNIYVAESAARMAAQGVEVDIFTRRDHLDLPEVVELSPGVNVHHLDAGHDLHWTKEQVPAHFNELTAEFKKALSSDQSYDLIHSHYWLSGKVAMPVAKELKLPLVHTMHTMARVKNLNLAEGERPEPMIRVQGETQIVAAASALTANTDAEAASLVSLYDACPDTVHVVTPGVDLYNFTPGAGRAAARKVIGIEMVSHSPLLRPKLRVFIIGGASGVNGSEVERLKELVSWLNIADVISFLPPVPRTELPNWYRAADLVCVPSYSESFGLVALEAQACGTPVVATAVGGLRTAVADGISGVLVDGHDPRAWSSVLSRLLQEPQRRVLLSMGAIEHASHFGWDATARGTLDIYDQVITDAARVNKSIG